MTKFGEFLAKRSVSKSALSKATGITVQRLNDLTLKSNSRLMGHELHLVSLALKVEISEITKFVYGHLTLPGEQKDE